MTRAWGPSRFGLAPWALTSLVLLAACDDTTDAALVAPAAFQAAPGAGTVTLSWHATGGYGTAIVRWSAEAAGALPADERLTVGRSFGASAVVLYAGEDETFVDATLEGCAAYVYQAFAIAGDGRSEPATLAFDGASAVTPATSPPSALDATLVEGGVHLVWDAPPTPADHVRIVRRLGAPVEGPDDGDGEIIANERVRREHLDLFSGPNGAPGLEGGGTYHYGAFACDACERCEAIGAHAEATTPIAFGDAPSELTVEPDGATVHFSWKAPSIGSFVGMRLFSRLGAPVEGPDDPDAVVIYEGSEDEARVATATFLPDIGDDERRYHFAVHACAGESCSDGATADRAFSLGDVLRGGGYIVYFRHAEAGICLDRTDLGTADETSSPDWWKSCARSCDVATAEQLSATGYEDAEAAGLSLRDAGVPFDRVLTSEYCRAVETADRLELVLPTAREPREEITPFVYGTDDERCTATRELLAGAALGAGLGNAAIVGHGGLPEACADLDGLAPGEAAVLRPGDDGPLLLARILPRDWEEAL